MVQEMNVLTTIESQHVDFHVSWMVLDTTVHIDMSSLEEEPNNGADRSYNQCRRLVGVGGA